MARIPFVVGNWKMDGTAREAVRRARSLAEGHPGGNREVAVCPPFPYLTVVSSVLTGTRVALGAQDVSRYAPGAHTGEVAARMLRDVGCRWVIVGHSERRTGLGESDEVVRAKLDRVRESDLGAIACVGETLEQRAAGEAGEVVERQVDALLADRDADELAGCVIAYEPQWAIGTGRTAAPEDAQAMHRTIRDRIAGRSPAAAASIRILYGGSVNEQNAASLFSMPDIDGGLIGGASLDPGRFIDICRSAAA